MVVCRRTTSAINHVVSINPGRVPSYHIGDASARVGEGPIGNARVVAAETGVLRVAADVLVRLREHRRGAVDGTPRVVVVFHRLQPIPVPLVCM